MYRKIKIVITFKGAMREHISILSKAAKQKILEALKLHK
jgi:hypothetical protein